MANNFGTRVVGLFYIFFFWVEYPIYAFVYWTGEGWGLRKSWNNYWKSVRNLMDGESMESESTKKCEFCEMDFKSEEALELHGKVQHKEKLEEQKMFRKKKEEEEVSVESKEKEGLGEDFAEEEEVAKPVMDDPHTLFKYQYKLELNLEDMQDRMSMNLKNEIDKVIADFMVEQKFNVEVVKEELTKRE